MPYMIRRDGSRYCVHKRKPDGSAGKRFGCHDTRGGAVRQIAAIEASESKLRQAFKVYQDDSGVYRWFGISSNAFEDREKEIVSSKALLLWTIYAHKTGDYGELQLLHDDALRLGEATAAYFYKPWLLVAGTFDSTPIGQKMAEYLTTERASEFGEWGMSIRFGYIPEDRADGVYEFIKIKEHTIGPRIVVANPWTPFLAVKEQEHG